MIAFAFALALCGVATHAMPNSTELSSAPQIDAPIVDILPENSSLQLVQPEDMTEYDTAEENAVGVDATEDDADGDSAREAAVSTKLRGSATRSLASARSLHRRRRRRKSGGFESPCTGITIGTCETSDWLLCIAGCLDIPSCKRKCQKAIVDPCYDKLQKTCEGSALELCEEAIKKAGSKSCSEICIEAAATADAASGGPEDPVGDVVAADIAASCEMSCESAVTTSGLTPGTSAFAKAVCKGIGF